ncbi:MAG: diaminopimelate epimerase [Gammaproteobacteria bacterium RIFCSPHIGHO2_12_FULL_35_23]|nr:MAG: diaminopimelate epimerase [Gammaproteobacteria bacterium RIFCSPHIGHO2_12_FULL_35_23]
MKLHFSKMHGLGNDFVIIDGVTQQVSLAKAQVQYLADRHLGIGCDQLLLLEKPTQAAADFKYRIYNANGCEVEQCGNGARCIAKFVFKKGLTNKKTCVFETKKGLITTTLKDNNNVSVTMGAPKFSPTEIPLLVAEQQTQYEINYQHQQLNFFALSMGNPHAVFIVEEVMTAPVAELGSFVEHHALFPEGVNVGFMQIVSPQEIKLRVHERHVAETKACGSGACAAVVAGIFQKKLATTVKVILLGGELEITWQGINHPVVMLGSATSVFDGIVKLA